MKEDIYRFCEKVEWTYPFQAPQLIRECLMHPSNFLFRRRQKAKKTTKKVHTTAINTTGGEFRKVKIRQLFRS